MTFESLVNQKLPEDIVRNLLLMIEEKKLRPGERLPPELSLRHSYKSAVPPCGKHCGRSQS